MFLLFDYRGYYNRIINPVMAGNIVRKNMKLYH